MTFLDLPAEIRNVIYKHLVNLESYSHLHESHKCLHQHQSPLPNRSTCSRNEGLCEGLYSPYTVHIERLTPGDCSRADQKYDARALYVTDPVIWQLNRQVRREALSFYLADFLSVDTSGHRGEVYNQGVQEQIGLHSLQQWWRKLDLKLASDVRTVEIRDFVDLIYPGTKESPCEADPYTGDVEGGTWPCELAVLKFAITNDGRSLTVCTPLNLVRMQKEKLQATLDDLAKHKRLGNLAFDGQDIYALICYLRTSDEDEWSISSLGFSHESVSVRFRMWATDEHVEILETSPWFIVKQGWRHVAATVTI